MRVLGVIPARGGSKGVPKKNIKVLGNKPLIAYTIQSANNSNLTDVIVSTDSEEIAEVSKQYGAQVPFIRPSDLAGDSAKAIPVIKHAVTHMLSIGNKAYDAVMMLQPTTPFRTSDDINKAIEGLDQKQAESVISVIDVEGHHPARMKFMNESGFLIDPAFCETYENQPRQELDPMYLRNGAIYLTRTDVLMNNSFKGNKCVGLKMPQERSVNIDTPFDFALAEWMLEKYIKI